MAEETGHPLGPTQLNSLGRYRDWLSEEAVVAGGIGPNESDRLDARHIADSLLFATPFPSDVGEILDLGSGVGLPGIPLAILFPQALVTLVDRSGRRVDLMRRAVRVLQLENVDVDQAEITDLEQRSQVVVSRAVLSPDTAYDTMNRLIADQGVGVLGGSWTTRPTYPSWETTEIYSEVLDQRLWLLIIRHS